MIKRAAIRCTGILLLLTDLSSQTILPSPLRQVVVGRGGTGSFAKELIGWERVSTVRMTPNFQTGLHCEREKKTTD
jgi:hypothetical protein